MHILNAVKIWCSIMTDMIAVQMFKCRETPENYKLTI